MTTTRALLRAARRGDDQAAAVATDALMEAGWSPERARRATSRGALDVHRVAFVATWLMRLGQCARYRLEPPHSWFFEPETGAALVERIRGAVRPKKVYPDRPGPDTYAGERSDTHVIELASQFAAALDRRIAVPS